MLVLSGSNSYSGGTTVNSGTLQVGAAAAIPGGAAAGGVLVDGLLDLNGKTIALAALNGSGTIDNTAAGAATLTIGAAGGDSQFGGTIRNSGGTLALTTTGAGTTTLSGSNTYNGTTTVAGGVLILGSTAALPGGTGPSGGLGNLLLQGGIVELGAGDFTRGLGTGAGQVQFTASGGFSAEEETGL